MNTKAQFDILIVGAGIVGLTLASLLAKKQFHIGILEANSIQDIPIETAYDARVSAISRAAQNIFKVAQSWHDMVTMRVSPYRYISVWDSQGDGVINFDSAELGEPNLGHIIEHSVMRKALLRKVTAVKQIEVFSSTSLKSLHCSESSITLTTIDGKELSTKLLVGADGAKSSLRELVGIPVTKRDYGHHALVATVVSKLPHQQIAAQCFLKLGVLAFLPMPDPHTCSIVWSTTPEEVERLRLLPEDVFRKELTEAFRERLGEITQCSSRHSFPLVMQHVQTYIQPRLALIGDAAHSIHPLAGQGVNLGLLDAACLAEIIIEAHGEGKDIGAVHVLRKYERWRKGDNLAMICAMDIFKELFGWQWMPIVSLRNLGLTMADKTAPLKHLLARKAMGLIGDLPKSAKYSLHT